MRARRQPHNRVRMIGSRCRTNRRALARYGYSDYLEANIEQAPELCRAPYDAIILLHILEHLDEPESTMAFLAAQLSDQGMMIGGSPTMPEWLGRRHQHRLRRIYADRMHNIRLHKHLSVITPPRIHRFARAQGFEVDFIAGTFFMRASGSPLENFAAWIRLNLLWGALFPSLAGEVYFALRRGSGPS